MSIVLDEYEWAKKRIEDHDLGKKPVETLSRVAKYYKKEGYDKAEIRKFLDIFLVQCDPSVSLVRWSDTLDKVAKGAEKFPLIQLDGIDVSDQELEQIAALDGKQLRRLAFTLLCTAKYWDAISERNNHWVNSPDREIMKMANINTSVKRQSAMFSELREKGLIRFSKKIDNLNVQVIFMEPGEPAIHIRDFSNLGYQYMKYYGGPYFECECCGTTVRMQNPSKGRRQKYCPECAAERHMRQRIDSVMRGRMEEQRR